MRTFALVIACLPALALADVSYTLDPKPASKSIIVTVTPDESGEVEVFRIPAWCPGFYSIKNYQTKISDVRAATADGSLLAVEKIDARGWRVINPDKKKITLSYKVLGDDPGLGFFAVNVRDDKAFVNGPAAFMFVDGKVAEPTRLSIKLPNPKWDVATGMNKAEDGTYTAGGYDELIDSPIQLGAMARRAFKVGDLSFEVVFASPDNQYRPNLDSQTEMIRKVSAPAVTLFGGAPFKRYVFIFHLALGDFGGGLEHRASTVMSVPNAADADIATLVAHEFFHTWNVKQMRPKVLGPFDYTQPVRTGNLWFAEGVTDYYAQLMTYRGYVGDAKWLQGVFSRHVTQLQASANRRNTTLEEAGRKTWESGGFGFGDLDYYNKGLLAGLLLDAAIRDATKGLKSLDDVMRVMYDRYRLPKPGYEEDAIRLAMNEVAGRDLSATYNRITRSTQEVPYELLSSIGLRLRAPGADYMDAGFETVNSKVSSVSDAAYEAGLGRGDEIVGASISSRTAELTVKRNGEEFTMAVPLSSGKSDRWLVEENPLATASQRRQLATWLKR